MNKKVKVIAMYLPQFHCIPENDEFWGKGFTDWVTVKNAKPLFEGHNQPRVPLNNNYYDLSIKENVLWQAKLASEYGIYGFGVYHYWFNNEKNILTKPAEIMRDAEHLGVKYFFVWDNLQWKRSWSNVAGNDWSPLVDNCMQGKDHKGEKVLIPYILGNEPDWEKHYNYLRGHFKSGNYEKIDNKPVFSIMHYSKEIVKMCDYWDQLAKNDGFDGIFFIYNNKRFRKLPSTAYKYHYEPQYSGFDNTSFFFKVCKKIIRNLGLNIDNKGLKFYNYDKVWNDLLKCASSSSDKTVIHGAFVNFDDSPRRGRVGGRIIIDSNVDKFTKYFGKLVEISENQNKIYIFLTAWNEWGEGAYIEPDMLNKYSYLRAIKKIIKDE